MRALVWVAFLLFGAAVVQVTWMQANARKDKVDRLCAVLAHANTDSLMVWGEDGSHRIDARAMAWVAVVQERYRRAYEYECR